MYSETLLSVNGIENMVKLFPSDTLKYGTLVNVKKVTFIKPKNKAKTKI